MGRPVSGEQGTYCNNGGGRSDIALQVNLYGARERLGHQFWGHHRGQLKPTTIEVLLVVARGWFRGCHVTCEAHHNLSRFADSAKKEVALILRPAETLWRLI